MSEKPSRRRTPQEIKALACERERVNVYGENDKASRKAIPRFKAASNRKLRRKAAPLLGRLARDRDDTPLDAALADATFAGLHPSKQKVADRPLGLVLDGRERQRTAGADRVPTRNRRESVRAEIERLSGRESLQRPPSRETRDE